ncbi:peptidase inhibitor family I36 protein [Clavibacter michiganensis]|jgi:hypothetical protein|uniref:Peptidase inhibitor family I36 n=1 Tax=Clavibacter michiganensis subsp. insidiosus TaxID=33014 RepID=A0A0D5CJG4_9MICO|nr:peptidase inhibitor family I36 protein [Clavibacter michiganensis]AJW79783.1 hypothetical protein VO01_12205 [Clavibacter michiganensis subsp. insidiosus]AWF99176.1 hypothetical protein BEH61_11760 [Clavibacter michiganensis subsp. insidiosus]AWG02208.1 hypothetical protein BEH62_11425 [Clavibacter michiganensis subsp. insidiosus]OQJ59325.1 hypothetical protein B5P21_04975 [Clavibacter michiganensis subsp. insidiosus]RII88878.1 hypothetical protein DZF92_01380 [Clavibacter michiganensis sub
MKMNLKRIAGAATLAATLVGGGIVAAAPANAACKASTFCAFDGRSEGGDLLVSSTYTGNGTVDVADNRVASARNNTTRGYCAVNSLGAGQNQILSRIQAGGAISDLSPNNDKTDFFWVGTAGGCTT